MEIRSKCKRFISINKISNISFLKCPDVSPVINNCPITPAIVNECISLTNQSNIFQSCFEKVIEFSIQINRFLSDIYIGRSKLFLRSLFK